MLKTFVYDDVTTYKMGRTILNYVPYFVHCFLIGDALIDTGTLYAGNELISAIDGKQINRIINTHYHEDHIGNNQILQRQYSAQILAHRDSIPYIQNPRIIKLKPYQRIIWGCPAGSRPDVIGESVTADTCLFRVIHTRGHSEGHFCLYEPQKKWLFTGDMFCGIRNMYLRKDEDFNLMLKSLGELSKLEIDTIFCSLKGVVNNGNEALSQKIKYMKDLKDKASALHTAGQSATLIRRKLLGREDAMFYITGGHFSKQHLIENILEA
jgi:glyoxylase-like metal-dependent hydrolase (beta-lactamase superfamily II)